jgi:hypothetical protein
MKPYGGRMKRRCTGYVLAAGLAVSGAIAGVPGHASAAITLYVGGPSAADTADCGAEAAPCATIQHGYLKAHDDDTIKVAAGRYELTDHRLEIQKRGLHLVGAMAGVDARTRSPDGPGETVVTCAFTTGEGTFTADADSVTIDGFTFEGHPGCASGVETSGGHSGYHVSNNIFTSNSGVHAASDGQLPSVFDKNLYSGTGVRAGWWIYPLANARFTDSAFQGLATPVHIDTRSSGVPARDITVAGNVMLGEFPVLLVDVSHAVITGNLMPGGWSGVELSGDCHDIAVTRNTITGKTHGGILVVTAHSQRANTGITIADNTIDRTATAEGRYGIDISGSSNIAISRNLILDSGQGGIGFTTRGQSPQEGMPPVPRPSSDVTVNQNTVLRSGGPGISVADGAYTGPMEVRHNRIVDNDGQRGLVNEAAGAQIDARWNWWGCNHEPDGSGCDHPAGTEAAGVQFRPWLVLTIASDPSGLLQAPHATIDAALRTDSGGATQPGPFFHPIPIAFTATTGVIEPASETTDADLRATALWSRGQAQAGRICASADHQKACLEVEATPSGPEILPPVRPLPPAGSRPRVPSLRPIVRVTG